MEFQHELVIPDEGLPFKFFLFEGSQGNYVREKHWHTSIEIFAVMEGSLTFYLNDEKYNVGNVPLCSAGSPGCGRGYCSAEK